MELHLFGDVFPCARAVKGEDFVELYDENGVCTFRSSQIKDFTPFVLEGGEWEAPAPTAQQLMERRLADMEDALCEADEANEAWKADIETALCEMDEGV